MQQRLSTKLQVQLEQAGADKLNKINFSNVVADPAEEKVIELAEIMERMAVAGNSLDGVIVTSQSRITK
ncbi:DUF1659 domain-containing protein [Enterococcus florum]|nr:hypothetical protein [Enterococcus florum]